MAALGVNLGWHASEVAIPHTGSTRLLVQGEMAALFLRHEGYLGAMGAFLKVHPMTPSSFHNSSTKEPRKVCIDTRSVSHMLWGSACMH